MPNDNCAQRRPSTTYTLGAIEHAVGTCDTTRPPVDSNPPVTGDGQFTDNTPGGGCRSRCSCSPRCCAAVSEGVA